MPTGLLDVSSDLLDQRSGAGEGEHFPKPAVELNFDGLAIKIFAKVEQVGFDGGGGGVEGGIVADADGGLERSPLIGKPGDSRINSRGGEKLFGGDVGGGESQIAPALLSLDHLAAKGVGAVQALLHIFYAPMFDHPARERTRHVDLREVGERDLLRGNDEGFKTKVRRASFAAASAPCRAWLLAIGERRAFHHQASRPMFPAPRGRESPLA